MANLRFALAVAASAAVILSAPFIRDIRDWIRAQFPGHFVAVVAAVVGLAIATAIVIALVRIRQRRLARYGAIVAALVLGTGYAMWNAQGIPEVDAVERFHFVEYGILTLLFYRAYRPIGDVSIFVLPVLAGLLVGTLEEWLQWFIPGRVGDMRDVFLNGAAIVSGLLFSLGLDPPSGLTSGMRAGSWRRIGATASIVTFIFATFVHVVHFGYEITDPDAGRFRSRYDVPTLSRISQDRASQWAIAPPLQRPQRLTREDQYMSEGLLHVQERNRGWSAGDFGRAWSENLILEKFYTPVLDAPSYVSKTGHRWPDAQRADAEQRSRETRRGGSYESMADAGEGTHFIRLWPRTLFWTIVVGLILTIIIVTTALDRSISTRAVPVHSL